MSRKLSNTLLKNVVDTYRGENQAICTAFEVGFHPNQMEENLAEQHNNEMVIIRAEQYKMSYSGHREQSVEPSTEHARHDRTWSVPSSSSVDILVASFYSVIQGEYMLNVKNKRMNSLKEEIECSKGHLLYLIDVHIFSKVLPALASFPIETHLFVQEGISLHFCIGGNKFTFLYRRK